jgi:hypothetical protein
MGMNVRHRSRSVLRALHTAAIVAFGGIVLTGCRDDATSPGIGSGEDTGIIEFELTPEGEAAAKGAQLVGSHKLPTIPLRDRSLVSLNSTGTADNSPFDLTYFGGPLVTGATNYPVYVNCLWPETAATCWGNGTQGPADFLRDLNVSNYIRIVNEYLGADALNKFPVAVMRTRATFATPNQATLQEIFHIVADAVSSTGASGYGAIYHVFLPQGTSVCIAPGNCYSPNDPASWTFCALHGSVNLEGNQHVLFTLEPYQGVDGCRFPGQTPNGLMDATASTLAHEFFETVTDPDLDGWSNALFGYELSDMCSAFGAAKLLNGRPYFLQAEYSNKLHMCVTKPAA